VERWVAGGSARIGEKGEEGLGDAGEKPRPKLILEQSRGGVI